MLTQQQHRLLLYIQKCIMERGYAPSYEEMKQALGLKSKSGVHRLIFSLDERGYINRLPNKARALEVLKVPGKKSSSPKQKSSIKKAFSGVKGPKRMVDTRENTHLIPLYGKIAAGTPIAALVDPNDFIDAPGFVMGFGDFYALRIEGDSMKDIGIFDNDIVIIKKQNYANDGDVVVALIDKEEATLKTIKHLSGNKVRLIAANKDIKDREYHRSQVMIQGVLRGLIRHYKTKK